MISGAMKPLFYGTHQQKVILFTFLLVLNILVFWLVYATGGSRYVYSHSMYVPIVLGASIFGTSGGLFFGLMGGILLGPFMPLDTSTGEHQIFINWFYRLIFFTLIGVLVGLLTGIIKKNLLKSDWSLNHNDISGAPNRRSLITDIQNFKSDNSCRLYMILLQNLYDLENTLGYEVIPIVIHSLKKSLVKDFRYRITFYHPKSNHVALLIENASSENYSDIEYELQKRLQNPIDFHGIPLLLETVCGSSDLYNNPQSAEKCIRQAEICIAQALLEDIQWLHYSRANKNISKRNIELLGFFKESLVIENNLSLVYQPKYDLYSRAITGVESLIRWNHHKLGAIPPGEFVPVIEKSQLINPMTYWVLEHALSDLKQLKDSNLKINKVSVNISSSNLLDPEFPNKLLQMLEKYNISPTSLELEVTESAIVNDYRYCSNRLKILSEMGILISIDDFGTGYSSLQHIASLPFDVIKIDQVFIRNLAAQPRLIKIVKAMIEMTHELGSLVVAEGIENQEIEDLLKSLNCDQGQGYYFSKPVSPAQLDHLFHS